MGPNGEQTTPSALSSFPSHFLPFYLYIGVPPLPTVLTQRAVHTPSAPTCTPKSCLPDALHTWPPPIRPHCLFWSLPCQALAIALAHTHSFSHSSSCCAQAHLRLHWVPSSLVTQGLTPSPPQASWNSKVFTESFSLQLTDSSVSRPPPSFQM